MNILVLIVILIFAVIISLFSTQNTANVTVTILNIPLVVPLYMVVFGSILFGLIMSWMINLMESISTTFTLLGKNKELKKTQKSLEELVAHVHELEVENARLKGEYTTKDEQKSDPETLAAK